jgi:hypothetical protein
VATGLTEGRGLPGLTEGRGFVAVELVDVDFIVGEYVEFPAAETVRHRPTRKVIARSSNFIACRPAQRKGSQGVCFWSGESSVETAMESSDLLAWGGSSGWFGRLEYRYSQELRVSWRNGKTMDS